MRFRTMPNILQWAEVRQKEYTIISNDNKLLLVHFNDDATLSHKVWVDGLDVY